MNKTIAAMKLLCCFLPLQLMTLTAFCQTTAQQNSVAVSASGQRVWNNVLALHNQVFGTKDSVLINALLSDQLKYGHSGGNIEDRQTMVHKASTSPTIYQNVNNQLLNIHFWGNTAMVRLELTATSIDNGVATPLHLGILQVWGKQKGQWYLLERQAVKIAPKKPLV